VVLPRFAGVRPSAVLPCATVADVAAALGRAREQGHAVAVRGGGHCFAGRSSGTGIVIDISPMTGVEIDGDRAVLGAGTRLAEVYDALAASGRTIPAGCGPTVGIAPPRPASPPTAAVFGAAPGTAAVDDLIRRLGVTPVSDARRAGPHHATKRWLAGDDPPDTRFAYLHSAYFRSPVPAADLITHLVGDRRPGEERELDSRRGAAPATGSRRTPPRPAPRRLVPAQAGGHAGARGATEPLAGRVRRAHAPVRHRRRVARNITA
jgi:FAD binding domain-containing protein